MARIERDGAQRLAQRGQAKRELALLELAIQRLLRQQAPLQRGQGERPRTPPAAAQVIGRDGGLAVLVRAQEADVEGEAWKVEVVRIPAELTDEERTLVLGVLLEEILAYTRSLPGSTRLRALLVFDEVYGMLPPHRRTHRPSAPRWRSNAGFWAVGRLQTDADRARVVESLAHAEEAGSSPAELATLLRQLAPRWFLVRNVHASTKLTLLKPR